MDATMDLSWQSLMKLAVIDLDPAVFRDAEDVGIAVAKTNIGMIIGSSRVDGLRCNNIVPRHHHHQRDSGSAEIVGIEAEQGARFIDDMEERPAQRQRRVL